MTRKRRVSQILANSLISSLCFVATLNTTAEAATLGFNANAPKEVRLTDHRTGKVYIATLEPSPDVNGTIDGVDLVLMSEHEPNQNLLAPFGIYHGLQPYDFVGLDLENGASHSFFGDVRKIAIRRTTTKLVVNIVAADTREVEGMKKGEGGSVEISSLRLNLFLEDDAKQTTSKIEKP